MKKTHNQLNLQLLTIFTIGQEVLKKVNRAKYTTWKENNDVVADPTCHDRLDQWFFHNQAYVSESACAFEILSKFLRISFVETLLTIALIVIHCPISYMKVTDATFRPTMQKLVREHLRQNITWSFEAGTTPSRAQTQHYHDVNHAKYLARIAAREDAAEEARENEVREAQVAERIAYEAAVARAEYINTREPLRIDLMTEQEFQDGFNAHLAAHPEHPIHAPAPAVSSSTPPPETFFGGLNLWERNFLDRARLGNPSAIIHTHGHPETEARRDSRRAFDIAFQNYQHAKECFMDRGMELALPLVDICKHDDLEEGEGVAMIEKPRPNSAEEAWEQLFVCLHDHVKGDYGNACSHITSRVPGRAGAEDAGQASSDAARSDATGSDVADDDHEDDARSEGAGSDVADEDSLQFEAEIFQDALGAQTTSVPYPTASNLPTIGSFPLKSMLFESTGLMAVKLPINHAFNSLTVADAKAVFRQRRFLAKPSSVKMFWENREVGDQELLTDVVVTKVWPGHFTVVVQLVD